MERAEKAFRAVFATGANITLVDTTAWKTRRGAWSARSADPRNASPRCSRTGAAKVVVFIMESRDGRHNGLRARARHGLSSFEYQSGETADVADAVAASLARRVALHLTGRLDWIIGLTAGDGDSGDGVSLSWASGRAADDERYVVYRARRQDDEFARVAEVAGTEFLDADALPGVRYWYRVRGSYAETLTDFSDAEPATAGRRFPRAWTTTGSEKKRPLPPAPPRRRRAAKKKARDEEY